MNKGDQSEPAAVTYDNVLLFKTAFPFYDI